MGSTPPLDPRLGQVIAGRYRLTSKIGRGGMGAIYEGVHAVTGKSFAIKTLLPGLGRVTEIAKRFEREAHFSSVLAHPNIVSVVDVGALDDGTLFLVFELVNGRSLGDVLENEDLPPRRALGIARQILEALAHAHAQGVVHRDLKPDNVMVADAGESDEERDLVKLLDFGIAKLVGEAQLGPEAEKLTQAGIAFGTPDYMAPEQALGEEVDARADLYALGIILYEMLTGGTPFDSPDKVAVLRMQVAVPPPPLEGDFAPELTAFIARALEKRREDRFADAAQMTAALDVAIAAQAARLPSADIASSPAESPVVAPPGERPISERSLPGRTLRGRRRALLIVAALAGALLVLAVLALGRGGREGGALPAPMLMGGTSRDEALATAWRAAGHAYALSGRAGEALAAFARVAGLAPGAADGSARAFVIEQASRGKTSALRARGRDLAAQLHLDDVDLLTSFSLDLTQGASCRDRRDAVPRLRALRDKRAVPILKRARGRSGGFLNLAQVNSCLTRDATETIEFLEALP